MPREFEGGERRRFSTFVLLGVLAGVVVTVVAFAVDSDFGWPVLVLTAICAGVAIVFRLIAGAIATTPTPRTPSRVSPRRGRVPSATRRRRTTS